MSKSEEVNLVLQMISATEKQISKNPRDRIQLQAELSQLYIDVGNLQNSFLRKLRRKRP